MIIVLALFTKRILLMPPRNGRHLVLEVLRDQEKPVSAQALFTQLRQQGHPTGLATVYRILARLRQEGILHSHSRPHGETFYSLVYQHQHYLTCIRCQRSIPLPTCPLHDWEKTLYQGHHGLNPLPETFQVLYHDLELFGLCSLCYPK